MLSKFERKFETHTIYNLHPYKIIGDVLIIPLCDRHKNVVGYAEASVEDAKTLLQYSFSKHRRDVNSKWYAISNFKIKMHHLILGKNPSNFITDHINRNGLDNRRQNIRFATKSQNSQNKSKSANATSKYHGVSKIKNSKEGNKQFRAVIRKGDDNYSLGSFVDEKDAAKIYDIYAVFLYDRICANNGLISEEEILYIENNKKIPPGFEIIKPERLLPKNIILRKGYYSYQKLRRGVLYYGNAGKSLDDCIAMKNKMELLWMEEDEIEEEKRLLNPILIDGNYVIPVNTKKGRVGLFVDKHVWLVISKYVWSVDKHGYASASIYDIDNIPKGRWLMHILIWILFIGQIPEGFSVDHIDPKRKFDNKLASLRLADLRLQAHNRSKIKNTIDKYIGVSYRERSFVVYIEMKHYGTFDTAEAAALKANDIFLELYPDIDPPNKIDTDQETTIFNRLSDVKLNRKYIESITTIKELKHIVLRLELDDCNKDDIIKMKDITCETFATIKERILNRYFPLENYQEINDKSMDDYDNSSVTSNWPMIIESSKSQDLTKPKKVRVYLDNTPSITYEEVMEITTVVGLQKLLAEQRLSKKHYGICTVKYIESATFKEVKDKIIEKLFPDKS